MTGNDFLELARQRVSCRAYDPARPVPDELLGVCLEAARLAPSACHRQPWRFVVVRDAELRARLCDQALLPGIPMPWLRAAPVLVVVALERQFLVHRAAAAVSGIPYHYVDAGIAGEHLVLAATALGLGTCWVGWIKPKVVRRLVKLPRQIEVAGVISVGWPQDAPEPRSRLLLAEIACAERWGEPWPE